jgi:prophage regulatory protein
MHPRSQTAASGEVSVADVVEEALFEREVVARVKMSRTTIWREECAGRFPRRRQLSRGRVGWLASEIDAFLRSRPVVTMGAKSAA